MIPVKDTVGKGEYAAKIIVSNTRTNTLVIVKYTTSTSDRSNTVECQGLLTGKRRRIVAYPVVVNVDSSPDHTVAGTHPERTGLQAAVDNVNIVQRECHRIIQQKMPAVPTCTGPVTIAIDGIGTRAPGGDVDRTRKTHITVLR